jgi:hypothetical protein
MANRKIFYILTVFLVSLFSGLVFIATQQSLRLSANDPQVQITQDILNSLSQGADPKQLSVTTVDMANTTSAFVIIYDNNQKAVGTTVELDKKTPVPPSQAFEKTKNNNENRFTWEAKKGLRQATVMVKYKDGYVLAGKSLGEIENRINVILRIVGIAWIVGIAATTLAFLFTRTRKQDVIEEVKVPSPRKSARSKKK